MSAYDFIDRSLENRDIEPGGQSERIEGIEKRQPWQSVLQFPEPLLGDRRRHSIFSGCAHNGWIGSRPLAALDQVLDVLSHLGNGRRLKNGRDTDLDLRNLVDVRKNPGGQQ